MALLGRIKSRIPGIPARFGYRCSIDDEALHPDNFVTSYLLLGVSALWSTIFSDPHMYINVD